MAYLKLLEDVGFHPDGPVGEGVFEEGISQPSWQVDALGFRDLGPEHVAQHNNDLV